ncbi:MAG: type II toxin-antitoxin system VapB family antitoxin [Symploca sp. SIO2E6]|nr:type II toxin-antitoxin system VapB family antitoxin [Symploca sp. SIO2E6]
MQIILDLDESLLSEALELTNLNTQEELVNLALQELVRSRRKKNLLDLAGKIKLVSDFDHKALRETCPEWRFDNDDESRQY